MSMERFRKEFSNQNQSNPIERLMFDCQTESNSACATKSVQTDFVAGTCNFLSQFFLLSYNRTFRRSIFEFSNALFEQSNVFVCEIKKSVRKTNRCVWACSKMAGKRLSDEDKKL